MTALIKILLPVFFILPMQLQAQEYSEQSLKTLFTSPQQRQAIDSSRRSSNTSSGPSVAGQAGVQINGMVKRGNGKNVVWVNGKSTIDSTAVDGVRVYSDSINTNNKIPVLIDGKKIHIRPGETWSEGAGVSDVSN
jgi:hypothetical protein